MSLSIDDVISTLRKLNIPAPILVRAETELEALQEEKKAEAEGAPPKAKSQYVSVILDPENKLAGLGDFVSLVVQVPETEDTGLTLDKMYRAVYEYRAKAKKPKAVQTLVDAVDTVKRKWFAEQKIAIKTREPVRTLVSHNQIPHA